MSISTNGWRGLLAVTATCVFAGACTGDDDDAEDTSEAAATTAVAATTSGTDAHRRDRGREQNGEAQRTRRHPPQRPKTRRERRTDRRTAPGGSGRGCGAVRRPRRAARLQLLDASGEHVGFDADFCRAHRRRRARRRHQGRVRRPRRPTPGSPRCSRARSTCSCATPRGRRAGTAPRARRSCTRRSTTARAMMVAADSGLRQRSTTWTARSICVAARDDHRGQRRRPSSRAAGSTGEVQSFDRRRPDPGGVHRRAVRRLVERRQPAHRPAVGLPGRSRSADDLRTRSSRRSRSPRPSSTATAAGRRRSNWAIFATIQAEEFGITSDERRRRAAPSDDPDILRVPRAERRRGRARCSTPASACRPTSPMQIVTPGRQLRRDLRAQPRPARVSSAASTRCGPTAGCSTRRRTADAPCARSATDRLSHRSHRARGRRAPPWRDVRVLAWVFQLLVLAGRRRVRGLAVGNFTVEQPTGRTSRPSSTSWTNPAAFAIPGNDFRQTPAGAGRLRRRGS